MITPQILVAEDNIIEARDIQKTLKRFGYGVSAIVSSGEEAIQKTKEIRPDLVLMDIKLKGEIDGVQAAKHIRNRFDIPVVYLTAYADEDTLQRAKITEPFGYIFKPFVERELHTNIEIGLYKHKMEKTLKEQERWLATTLNSIGDAVIATDKQGNILFVNPIAEALTGWKQKDALGRNLTDVFNVVSEETYTVVETPVTKVIQENVIVSLTNHILIAKDGTEIPVDDSAAPIRDDNGNITGAVLVFHDVTERKQAEKALRESKLKYQMLFEASTDAIFLETIEGRILDCNSSACKMLGYSKEELIGLTVADLVPEEIAATIPDIITEELATGGIFAEASNKRKDGSVFPVEVSTKLIKEGEEQLVVAYVHDLTERKQTEEALQESEERYRAVSELTSDFAYAFRVEPNGALVTEWMTDSFTHITGFSPEEAGLRGWISIIHPEDKPFVYERLKITVSSQLERNYQSKGAELRIVTKNHEVRWLRVHTYPIWDDAQGRIIHIYGAAQDITERKRAEEKLKKAKTEAELANQVKSEFLANISHEIRTPLNAILGYAQIFLRDENLTGKQRDAIRIVQHSGEYLLTMINDILDLSKIEAQKVEIESAELYLPRFLNSLVDMIQVRVHHKEISFTADIASDIPEVIYGDEKRLRQVLLNLLSNAIKFTEKGRIRLRVYEFNEFRDLDNSQTRQRINASTHKLVNSSMHKLRFEVDDTGIGISPDHIKEIFLPFQQVHDRRAHFQGTGLGLAISQKLLRMMGSELHVTSTPGEGSTFWFDVDFPEPALSEVERIEAAEAGEAKPFRAIIGFNGDTRKILIVDDNDENRAVLKDMLSPLGFEIIEAVDGHETLNTTKENHPDIILMDLMMSGLNGFETTRHIRQIPELNDIIIIGVSANVSSQTHQKSIAAGCDDFLAKPVDIEALLERLQVHLKLEWIYKEQCKTQETPTPSEQPPIIPPPKQELVVLYDLARSGDIANLRKQIPKIADLDSKFIPFAAKLEQFANEFQMNAIKKFLETYIEL